MRPPYKATDVEMIRLIKMSEMVEWPTLPICIQRGWPILSRSLRRKGGFPGPHAPRDFDSLVFLEHKRDKVGRHLRYLVIRQCPRCLGSESSYSPMSKKIKVRIS